MQGKNQHCVWCSMGCHGYMVNRHCVWCSMGCHGDMVDRHCVWCLMVDSVTGDNVQNESHGFENEKYVCWA